jgi:hypothetical protein
VQVDVAKPGALRERFEPAQHVARLQRCADFGGEEGMTKTVAAARPRP